MPSSTVQTHPLTDTVQCLVTWPGRKLGQVPDIARILQQVTHLPFVNADMVPAERWPDAQDEHATADTPACIQTRRAPTAQRGQRVCATLRL